MEWRRTETAPWNVGPMKPVIVCWGNSWWEATRKDGVWTLAMRGIELQPGEPSHWMQGPELPPEVIAANPPLSDQERDALLQELEMERRKLESEEAA